MKKIHIVVIGFGLAALAAAAPTLIFSDSTKAAGTGVSNSRGGCTAWSGPTNITTSNDVYASAPTHCSDGLYAKSFGFTIPTGSTIDGVGYSYEGYQSMMMDTATLHDYSLDLRDDTGSILGNTQTFTGPFLGPQSPPPFNGDIVSGFGTGSLTPWGLTSGDFTPAMVNDSDFGIELYFDCSLQSGGTINMYTYIDQVRMKIWYTTPPGEHLVQVRTSKVRV